MRAFSLFSLKGLMVISVLFHLSSAQAYQQACDLVAQLSGKMYQAKPNRFASRLAPEDLPQNWSVRLIERNGMWFIYQAKEVWFTKQACAPKILNEIDSFTTVEFQIVRKKPSV